MTTLIYPNVSDSLAQPDWMRRYADKITTARDAVSVVRRGQRTFIGSGCAQPQLLVAALADRAEQLEDNPVIHILTRGAAPYVDARLFSHFRHNAFFIGPNVREAVANGRADFTPMFLSEIPQLFRSGKMPIDVALIQVSVPDEHGFCSYGVSVDVVKAAAESARLLIAEVNPNMPRTLGDSFIHVSRIQHLVPSDLPILETHHDHPDEVSQRIGRHIADLIEDGSTLQMGIGTIPDAVLACLTDRRDLGVHTEMFSEGVIDLVRRGVINGRRKNIHPGKIVASFIMGTRRLYDFVDNNPMIEFHPTEYTNDPFLISQHDRMVAINSAIQIDLTGQVCADSIGAQFFSGIGGQVDFIRGASRSKGGKPIIALPSTAKNGSVSRIVPILSPGAGVVTTRGDVHYVVTEYGAVDLHGKTVRERALALIHIAHPMFRERLMDEARKRNLVYADQPAVLAAGAPELDRLTSELTLPNNEVVHFRPIRPSDEEMEREMLYSFSPETVFHRFFQAVPSFPHQRISPFVNIDYATQMALVGFIRTGNIEKMVAVGRYVVNMATGAAEVAFVVRDAYQHHGIGRHLFKQLTDIARDHGVTQFTADVLADNAPMVHLFHDCACGPVKSELSDGVYHLSFELNAPLSAA